MAAELPVLGYWDIRGNTEATRQILHYAGIKFNDKRYPAGSTPETARESWLKEKFTLGLDFPNLPYWIEPTGLKLTQSTAILRHAARLAKLTGANEEEQSRLEMIEQQAIDLRVALTQICYNPNFESLRVEFVKTIPEKLKLWSNFLGNKKFLIGDKVTYVDFLLADILSLYSTFAQQYEPSAFNDSKILLDYVQRVESLPGVAEYLKSGVYHKMPYNGAVAFWGGKRE